MLQLLILPFSAFVLALLLIVAIAIVAGAGFRWPGRIFSYLMLLMASTSVATIILSGRVLTFLDEGVIVSDTDVGSAVSTKLLLVVVLGCSVALCVAWILDFKNYKANFDRFASKGLRAPTDITLAFVVFFVTYNILPIFFGQRYYFHVNLVYPIFTYVALLLWARLSSTDPVTIGKQCLALIVFSSLIAAIIAPQLAMQPGYIGLIPGFDLRFWGLTTHANTLGAAACVLFVLELAEPTRKKWLRKSILAAAGLTLILTQSKTSIVAAFVGFLIIFGWRLIARTGETKNAGTQPGSSISIGLLGVFIVPIVVVGAFQILLHTGAFATLESQLQARAVSDLSTATGRTLIWKTAIEGGLENPWFGQGADFWGPENRHRLGFAAVASSHNLFLEAFSRSGIVGLSALLVFLYFLLRYSIRAATPTRGGSIALLAVLLMRSAFEVNFHLNTIITAEVFAMLAHFTYVFEKGAKPVVSYTRAGERHNICA